MRNINNGLNELNGFLLLGKFNNGLNGYYSQGVHLSPLGFAACQSKKCTNRARTDCLLVKFNNGLNGLNRFDGCVKIRLIRLIRC